MEKRSFLQRFTSRPFLLAVADFIKNIGVTVVVLNPNVPSDKVNAIVGLALAATGVVSVFIGSEINRDRAIEQAHIAANAPQSLDSVTAGGDVTVQGIAPAVSAVAPEAAIQDDAAPQSPPSQMDEFLRNVGKLGKQAAIDAVMQRIAKKAGQ